MLMELFHIVNNIVNDIYAKPNTICLSETSFRKESVFFTLLGQIISSLLNSGFSGSRK